VTLWTAGFDIIYACQDYAFDVESGLHSIPQRFGIPGALWIARVLHVGMLVCLVMLVQAFALGALAWAGIAAVACLLAWEHRLVGDDLLAHRRRVFHHERLRERHLLRVLGRRYFSAALNNTMSEFSWRRSKRILPSAEISKFRTEAFPTWSVAVTPLRIHHQKSMALDDPGESRRCDRPA
jgi:hypothetical protein